MPSSADSAAEAHLAQVDPVMGRLIDEVGPCILKPRATRSPFESLARAIAFQQLHEKAAESIVKRFIALFPGRRFPRPEDVLAADVAAIRGAGFSMAKTLALRDLAARTLDGTVPPGRAIRTLDDEAIVEQLTEARRGYEATITITSEAQQDPAGQMRIHEVLMRRIDTGLAEDLVFLQCIDVTERREIAMRTAQSERMESLGVLAGSLGGCEHCGTDGSVHVVLVHEAHLGPDQELHR